MSETKCRFVQNSKCTNNCAEAIECPTETYDKNSPYSACDWYEPADKKPKRFTQVDEYGIAHLKDFSKGGTTAYHLALNRLAELEDKLEDGRFAELQCKIGDAVYETDTNGAKIFCSTVKRIIIDGQNIIYETDGVAFDERAIGKTIFLTAEAVEARAKELQGKL